MQSLAMRAAERIQGFFSGAGFPAFALSLLFLYEVGVAGLLLVPASGTGPLAEFAADFKLWCFGLDPATGRMEWSLVVAMLGPPLMLAAVFLLLWREPLREAERRGVRALLLPAVAALAVATTAAAAFATLGTDATSGELPFPAEELRTAHRPPAVSLVDHHGRPVDLAALRGQVVMLTAVYASCPHTCPLVLAQARRAVDTLPPEARADLHVVAVTLDPAHDTPEVLAELAMHQSLDEPLWHLATGDPPAVERTLDAMGVSRRRDPETGIIDHANLFLLVDRDGRLAYRFSLGERQERWLGSALELLLRERADVG